MNATIDAELEAAALWYRQQAPPLPPDGEPGLWLWINGDGSPEGVGTTPAEARDFAVREALAGWEYEQRTYGTTDSAMHWLVDAIRGGGPIQLHGDPATLRTFFSGSSAVFGVHALTRAARDLLFAGKRAA